MWMRCPCGLRGGQSCLESRGINTQCYTERLISFVHSTFLVMCPVLAPSLSPSPYPEVIYSDGCLLFVIIKKRTTLCTLFLSTLLGT